jgi:hypothetical protein
MHCVFFGRECRLFGYSLIVPDFRGQVVRDRARTEVISHLNQSSQETVQWFSIICLRGEESHCSIAAGRSWTRMCS